MPRGTVAEEPPPGDSGDNHATLLRALVRERHWQKFQTFEVQFRRAARDLAQREGEPALASVTVSARSWDRWLSGNVKTEPRPDTCRVLEHMFGHPVRDLLAPASQGSASLVPVPQASEARIREQARTTPPGTRLDGPAVDQPAVDQAVTIDATAFPDTAFSAAEPLAGNPVQTPARDGSWDVNEVERRELLRLLSGIAVAAPLMGGVDKPRRDLDTALNAPTTAADVAEWERVVHDYGMESGRVAPAALLPELLTDLDEAQRRLGGAPSGLRAPMARVCGLLSALAAINLLNAGDARTARRFWRTALRAIDQSDDRPSKAWLYATRARFALAEAKPPAVSLSYADKAIGLANGIPCAGLAFAQSARAVALAIAGDHDGSVGAVHDLGDIFATLPLTAATARGAFDVSEQALYAAQSRVYSYAGRYADAAKAQKAGLALVPNDCPVPLADFELYSAVTLIRSGDPSEGARHVVRTIQALPASFQQSAVIRQSAARALDLVPVAAAGAPAVSQARELLSLPAAPAT